MCNLFTHGVRLFKFLCLLNLFKTNYQVIHPLLSTILLPVCALVVLNLRVLSRLLSFNIDLVVIFPGYCCLILTWLLFFQGIVIQYRLGCFSFLCPQPACFSRVPSAFRPRTSSRRRFCSFFVKKKIMKCNFTSRRATDFHLAKICGGIVAVFVVCNLPRLAIGGFEIWRWIVASIQIQFDIPLQDPHYPSLHRVIGPVLGSWDSGGKMFWMFWIAKYSYFPLFLATEIRRIHRISFSKSFPLFLGKLKKRQKTSF